MSDDTNDQDVTIAALRERCTTLSVKLAVQHQRYGDLLEELVMMIDMMQPPSLADLGLVERKLRQIVAKYEVPG